MCLFTHGNCARAHTSNAQCAQDVRAPHRQMETRRMRLCFVCARARACAIDILQIEFKLRVRARTNEDVIRISTRKWNVSRSINVRACLTRFCVQKHSVRNPPPTGRQFGRVLMFRFRLCWRGGTKSMWCSCTLCSLYMSMFVLHATQSWLTTSFHPNGHILHVLCGRIDVQRCIVYARMWCSTLGT